MIRGCEDLQNGSGQLDDKSDKCFLAYVGKRYIRRPATFVNDKRPNAFLFAVKTNRIYEDLEPKYTIKDRGNLYNGSRLDADNYYAASSATGSFFRFQPKKINLF
ncbi:hypothetical protein DPMN_172802 [Dreissena polymorpha]|uniref:Uncharacterized protein n=1 Tax=Dreissena polymorpha TaxID=45954 RepID=A0A9D4IGY7_DREPO|nr:hypothetical protein DPMN_172802 [Dreissena polymorpha]